ncbi:hypothetical protein [Rhizobium leguminosarum]|uniref:Uncharacterized protein n=1 Tax=Rhizobium leguminosarum TaxID=384 RepID=A0A7M3DTZ6_RHILE|nr:hypothetical protein [Rhizobium leguminosarum]TAY52165.1 hypothetical protein ELH90_11105 [Rhizobium leguminosarum]
MDEYLSSSHFLIADWKIIWTGVCATLRTSIDLFQVDARSCINQGLRDGVKAEWADIRQRRSEYPIYWEFLKKERDNIMHEYQWSAYEMWMNADGHMMPPTLSLLSTRPDDYRSVLVMKEGHYKGHNSVDLLREAADWVDARIISAIERAGLDPNEDRNLINFSEKTAAFTRWDALVNSAGRRILAAAGKARGIP